MAHIDEGYVPGVVVALWEDGNPYVIKLTEGRNAGVHVTGPMDDDLFVMAPGKAPAYAKKAAASSQENDRLLSATQQNNATQVQALIDSGIDVSYANSAGQTALHIAALWGNLQACETLLQNSAKLNVRNSLSGATPLHMAAASSKDLGRRMACAKLIIDAGADLMVKDESGLMPWQHTEGEFAALLRPST